MWSESHGIGSSHEKNIKQRMRFQIGKLAVIKNVTNNEFTKKSNTNIQFMEFR